MGTNPQGYLARQLSQPHSFILPPDRERQGRWRPLIFPLAPGLESNVTAALKCLEVPFEKNIPPHISQR